jgi:hypothetical protein
MQARFCDRLSSPANQHWRMPSTPQWRDCGVAVPVVRQLRNGVQVLGHRGEELVGDLVGRSLRTQGRQLLLAAGDLDRPGPLGGRRPTRWRYSSFVSTASETCSSTLSPRRPKPPQPP